MCLPNFVAPRVRQSKVEVARELAPKKIGSLPQDDMLSHMKLMAEAGADLPIATKGCLVKVYVGECIEAAMVNAMFAEKLVEVVKCWCGPCDESRFDMLEKATWRLQNLALDGAANMKWFQDTVFDIFLIPLVEQGAGKSPQVVKFCQLALGSWEEADDDSMTDEMLTTMEAVLRLWRSLVHIVEMKPYDMSEMDFEMLQFIRSRKSSSSRTPEVALSIAWHGSEWYKKRMDSLYDSKGALDTKEDLAAMDAPATAWSIGVARQLAKVCQNMCNYRHELPIMVIAGMEELVKTKVASFLRVALEGAGGVDDDSKAEELGQFASEVGLAFSLDPKINELVERAQARHASVAASSKAARLVRLAEKVRSVDPGDLEGSAAGNTLLAYMGENKAIKLEWDHIVSIGVVCNHMFVGLEALQGQKELTEPPVLLQLMDALVNKMPEASPQRWRAKAWRLKVMLSQILAKWQGMGDTVEERIKKDDRLMQPSSALSVVLSRLRDVQQVEADMVKNDIQDQVLGTFLEKVIGEAIRMKDEAWQFLIDERKASYGAVFGELQRYTETRTGEHNKPWYDSGPSDKPASDFLQMCMGSVMNIRPESIEASKTAFEQARWSNAANGIGLLGSPYILGGRHVGLSMLVGLRPGQAWIFQHGPPRMSFCRVVVPFSALLRLQAWAEYNEVIVFFREGAGGRGPDAGRELAQELQDPPDDLQARGPLHAPGHHQGRLAEGGAGEHQGHQGRVLAGGLGQ